MLLFLTKEFVVKRDWIGPEIVELIHYRDFYGRKTRILKDPLAWQHSKRLRNQVSSEIKICKRVFLCKSLRENINKRIIDDGLNTANEF